MTQDECSLVGLIMRLFDERDDALVFFDEVFQGIMLLLRTIYAVIMTAFGFDLYAVKFR